MRYSFTPKVTVYPWRKTFAFLPVLAYDNTTNSYGTVWLERVWVREWWNDFDSEWVTNYRTLESMDGE